MRRKILIGNLLLVLLLTGCNNTDIFGAGSSDLVITQPYSNGEGYIIANFDLKGVEERENDIINEYDFSGPMNSVLNKTNSTNTTIIAPSETTLPPTSNSNLVVGSNGLSAPLDASNGTIVVSSNYGDRNGAHHGVDFSIKEGTPVYSIYSGKVVLASFSSTAGNWIILEHDGGPSDVKTSIYMHLQRFDVAEGAYVEKGQIIGYSGNTGQSTGPHLHLELCKSSGSNSMLASKRQYVDPLDYLPTGWYK